MKKWSKITAGLDPLQSTGYVKSSITFGYNSNDTRSDINQLDSEIAKYESLLQDAMEQKSQLEAKLRQEDALRDRIVQLIGGEVDAHVVWLEDKGDMIYCSLLGNTETIMTALTSLCSDSTLRTTGPWTTGTINGVDVRFRLSETKPNWYVQLYLL